MNIPSKWPGRWKFLLFVMNFVYLIILWIRGLWAWVMMFFPYSRRPLDIFLPLDLSLPSPTFKLLIFISIAWTTFAIVGLNLLYWYYRYYILSFAQKWNMPYDY